MQLIINTLSDYLLQTKKSELRDIAGIGLRTVVAQIPPESPTAPLVIQGVTPKLIKGISVRRSPHPLRHFPPSTSKNLITTTLAARGARDGDGVPQCPE